MFVAADVESAVRERYIGAARATEPSLFCPTSYDSKLLAAVPDDYTVSTEAAPEDCCASTGSRVVGGCCP